MSPVHNCNEEEAMISNRGIFLASAALLVLSLASSAAISDQTCRNVQSNVTDLSVIFADPDGVCNGYELCQYSEIKGTLNGRWWSFWNLDDEEFVADNTALVLDIDSVFETNHGDIYTEERGILNFFAPDGYAAHIGVTGGTGRYEGATGWMTGTLIFIFEESGMLTGEICWNGD